MRLDTEAMLIREMTRDDARAIAKLSGELGYPVDVEEMSRRMELVLVSNDRVVYVACAAHDVIGWIELGIVHHLAAGTYGEIAGFIISSEHRNLGVGRRLLNEGERWVESRGITTIVVRSRVAREAAHRFYLREGYCRVKTSAVFSKEL